MGFGFPTLEDWELEEDELVSLDEASWLEGTSIEFSKSIIEEVEVSKLDITGFGPCELEVVEIVGPSLNCFVGSNKWAIDRDKATNWFRVS